MNENPDFLNQRVLEQEGKLKKNLNLVDQEVLLETAELIHRIFETTGRSLPKKKIKFLLSSPDKQIFMSRVNKLGKRFFNR